MNNAEQFLNRCEKEVKKYNFIEATNQFRLALNATGDPACFFFGDIVRILVNNRNVNFEMDQLYTDILGANKMGIISLLIDRISNNESIITKFNRIRENKIIKKYKIIERGHYND